MRITSKMMTGNIAENLYRQAEQILKSQKAVATGKRIQRVSDDPVGLGKVLDYRRSLANIEQYQQNVIRGKMRLKMNGTLGHPPDTGRGGSKSSTPTGPVGQ
jgi:flagellar hook-associated protein 3 FlgL